MGKCKFNKEWLPIYKWLREVTNDNEKANCIFSNKVFTIANKGIANKKQHQQSGSHLINEQNATKSVTIDSIFPSKIFSLFVCCYYFVH